MAEVKFTKNAFREQQQKLMQLQSYLPTLQLKKKMLQFEISVTHVLLDNLYKNYQKQRNEVDEYSKLFSDKEGKDIVKYASVMHVEKSYENIAGVEIPNLKRVVFTEDTYNLFETPPWVDGALVKLKELVKIKQNMNVIEEKKRALAKELRDVSIRVNLFEKILIPRTTDNIKKIKIFLGDQELAAVSQAKVAKQKILAKKTASSLV